MTPPNLRSWTRPGLGAAAVGAAIAIPLLVFGSSTASASDSRLERFTSCDDLVAAARERALQTLANRGSFGIPVAGGALDDGVQRLQSTAAKAAEAAPAHSTTNVQEAGIDEPDIVKTDGKRTFAVANGRIYAVDTSGARPRIASSLQLPGGVVPQEMVLSGNRLVVIAGAPMLIEPAAIGAPAGVATKMMAPAIGSHIFAVDVTDIGSLRVEQTLKVDANYVSARLSGTTLRMVLGSDPLMQLGMNAGSEAELRSAVGSAGVNQFIPSMTMTDAAGATTSGPLVGCGSVSRPSKPGDLGLLTLVTMDLSRGITPVDSDAVLAQGYTVMASANRVYVALGRTELRDRTMTALTDVHAFDAAAPNQTTYVGSGTVDGTLLNQFAMSEFDGRLRIATTLESYQVDIVTSPQPEPDPAGGGVSPGSPGEDPTTGGDEPPSTGSGSDTPVSSDDAAKASTSSSAVPAPTVGGDDVVSIGGPGVPESQVAVLELRGDELQQVGRVGGLGKGERIFSVRFIGRTGYVVTFRQTDPLYTIDLSDPTAPRVAGALKIPGYSSYLHPIDENTLIGVGQNADPRGRTFGLQVGVFDVSDPAAPKRTHVWTMRNAGSEAEYDHHAFLWWPATRTVVLPLMSYDVGVVSPDGRPVKQSVQPNAVALRIAGTGITRTGTIRLPKGQYAQVRRSVVIGDQLLSISDGGILTSSLDAATPRSWVAFK